MKERPILFSGPMVRAILDGSKTQTRRVVKPQHFSHPGCDCGPESLSASSWCPYGNPGDLLWVREAWRVHPEDLLMDEYERPVNLKAVSPNDSAYAGIPWRPSIFMPRWASRLLLEITDVRVQRLQDISEKDAEAEGITCIDPQGGDASRCWVPGVHDTDVHEFGTARCAFHDLWDSINAKTYPWESNPWVWAITFEVTA